MKDLNFLSMWNVHTHIHDLYLFEVYIEINPTIWYFYVQFYVYHFDPIIWKNCFAHVQEGSYQPYLIIQKYSHMMADEFAFGFLAFNDNFQFSEACSFCSDFNLDVLDFCAYGVDFLCFFKFDEFFICKFFCDLNGFDIKKYVLQT